MFAPYCATCDSRVLLGTRRIVRFASAETGLVDVVLRCYCGAEVAADASPPDHTAAVPAAAARVAFATSMAAAAS